MAASVRDELIRLGIIKPAAPSSEPSSPAPPLTSPLRQPPVPIPATVEPPPIRVAEPSRTMQQQVSYGRRPVHRTQRAFHQEMPGDPAWFAALESLSKTLCAMREQDFRTFLSGKQGEELFNICEYIQRIMQGKTPPPCWLVQMVMDFGDLGQALRLADGALWDAYHLAEARHQAALAAWEALRLQGGSDEAYTRLTARYPRGSEGRRWIDAAWNDPSLPTRRKVELRAAMSAYSTQRLRYKIGLKRAPAQPTSSVWEAKGQSRRFGGGRPRNERFRR